MKQIWSLVEDFVGHKRTCGNLLKRRQGESLDDTSLNFSVHLPLFY